MKADGVTEGPDEQKFAEANVYIRNPIIVTLLVRACHYYNLCVWKAVLFGWRCFLFIDGNNTIRQGLLGFVCLNWVAKYLIISILHVVSLNLKISRFPDSNPP